MRMPKLVIHQEKVEDPQVLVDICPFGAMEEKDGKLSINAACKMCKLCVKKGPAGAVEYVEDEKKKKLIRVSGTESLFMSIMLMEKFIQ